jgi:hypothetical protein
MEFKVGDKVGLNVCAGEEDDSSSPWKVRYYTIYDCYFPAIVATIVSINKKQVKVAIDHFLDKNGNATQDSYYEDYVLDSFLDGEDDEELDDEELFVDQKHLVSVEDFQKIVKKAWEDRKSLASTLEEKYKKLQEEFAKINALAIENGCLLKEFDSSYCLRNFIDQAGWSSSSMDC